MAVEVTTEVAGRKLTLETGRLARQADGAVLVKAGNNMVLVTAVSSKRESTLDFFPLTVEYQEKFYATGKIPGGYFKREGRPTTIATLTARLIDRPIRPLFPEGYRYETQIVATTLSYDGTFPLEVLASLGSSAALHISDIPFSGPTAAVQIGHIDGKYVINPIAEAMEKSRLDLLVAGTSKGLLMVEGEAQFLSEDEVLSALKEAHQAMTPLFEAQEELRRKLNSPTKRTFISKPVNDALKKKVNEEGSSSVLDALKTSVKKDRLKALDAVKVSLLEKCIPSEESEDNKAVLAKEVSRYFEDLKYEISRELVLNDKVRVDGRKMDEVRPISCEVAILPRAHGSGLFTRGETQVLGTVTLGTGDDEQMVDALRGMEKRRFLLHYNFPPFSVGETGRLGGQSRREIGHGILAERGLKAILPDFEKFPYTIRIVAEVLESNGSSSMGTVCAGVLGLLDAGVPIKANVAGIAMGLISDGSRHVVLSDILGDEDHLGDMDFKVAGSREGITSLQMDIKIDSIGFDVMETALKQAKEGRLHILGEMEKVMQTPRGEISEFAPRIETIRIKPEKVREVIGAGGKVIRGIVEATGVKIDIEDDGTIHVASSDPSKSAQAIEMINQICAEAEIGKVYSGRVVKIMEFGAFVEIFPNAQGLLHVSEIAHERVRNVTDYLKEGDRLDVKVLDVDRAGRIKLSRKVLIEKS